MKGKNIITMNGRQYDALTGMPITQSQPISKKTFSDIAPAKPTQAKAKPTPRTTTRVPSTTPAAHAIHRQPQRSQTLHRAAIKRPAAATQQAHAPAKVLQKSSATPIKVDRSPAISKFGNIHQPAKTTQPAQQAKPAAPSQHPAVVKAITTSTPPTPPPAVHQSSKELKESLIKERLAQVDAAQAQPAKRKLFGSPRRLTTILTSTLAVLLLSGYITYLNLPNISMKVAATRAGVSTASFPSYKPDGYNFTGPITYSPGEIAINFKSSKNSNSYTVKQKTSNWNSQAVLDNFVTKYSDSYLTYQERGLTIYAFDDKAAWVNGGLLYTIEGNASLSGEQILRIATSL